MSILSDWREALKWSFLKRVDKNTLIHAAARRGERITSSIVPQSTLVSSADLGKWRLALNAANDHENPDRSMYYEILDNLKNDLHLDSAMDDRKLAISSSSFRLVNDKGETDEQAAKLLDQPWMYDLLELIVDRRFRGSGLIELFETNEEGRLVNVDLVPEAHVNFKKGIVMKEIGDDTGWDFRNPKYRPYYMQVGKNKDLGVLEYVAPMSLAKKFCLGANSQFVDKYGVPYRWVTTPSHDKKRHEELGKILDAMGPAGWGVFQEDEKAELLTLMNSGDHSRLFEALTLRCNSEMSKKLLGQDSTKDTGSKTGTYGSVKVLQEISEYRHWSDKRYVKAVINTELIPRLVMRGYNELEGLSFDWDDSADLEPEQYVDAVQKLSMAGFEVDLEQIETKTGIRVTGYKNTVGAAADDQKKKLKRDVEAWYKPNHSCSGHHHHEVRAVSSELEAQIRRLIDAIITALHQGNLPAGRIDPRLIILLASAYVKATEKIFQEEADSKAQRDTAMIMRNNLYAFSAAKSYLQLQEMNELLVDEDGNTRSFEDFRDAALEVHDQYNVNWLRSEYNHAVNSAEMAQQWMNFSATADLSPYLTYRTIGDDRVRNEHRALNNVTRPVNDAFWDRNYPPNGWGCRCDVVQTNDKAKLTTDSKAKALSDSLNLPPMFNNNVGKTGIVFSSGHPYFQEAGKLSELEAEKTYGMRSLDNIYADPGKLDPDPEQLSDFESWFSGQNGGKTIRATDQFGDDLTWTRASLEDSEYANQLQDILSQADEVWLVNNKRSYIKYYNSLALVAQSNKSTGSAVLSFTTDELENLSALRKGVLMHR